jgi:ClpP class serine protease
MHLLSAVCNRPWLITQDWLHTIVKIVSREHLDPALAQQIREDRASRPSAIAMQRGRRIDGSRAVLRGNVAIIPVVGPIVRRADMFTEMSGMQSLETIVTDLRVTLETPEAEAILFAMDTPGGEVTGISELAAHIYDARKRKPIQTYVEGLGASAGYWLASATERIVMADTASVGSIGVVLAVYDPDKMSSRTIEFVSSQSPSKRPDPRTEAGKAVFQRIVDDTASVFVGAVAQYRGVSEAKVLADYGQGDVLVGARAVKAGLADEVSTFESTLAALAAEPQRRRNGRPIRFAVQENSMNLREMFTAMFGGAQDAGLIAGDGTHEPIADSLLVAQSAPAEVAALHEAQTRAAAAEAKLKEVQEAALKQAATIFAKEQIAASRAVPAQQAHLEALYILCETHGQTAALTGLFSAAPKHGLLAEQVPADTALLGVPLQRPDAGTTSVEDARNDARAYAEKQNSRERRNGAA